MTRARPLPSQLDAAGFTVASAREAGVSHSRLRATDLDAPTRGVRHVRQPPIEVAENETASERMERLRDDLFQRAALIGLVLTADQFFSHETGLALAGVPLPYTTAAQRELHVSTRHPAAKPRRARVVGHRLPKRDPARSTARGLPIEEPARMWRQVAGTWSLDDLICAGDHLVCPRTGLATLDDLRAELALAGDVPGHPLARALALIRVGAETAEETRVRLLIARADLPEPALNWSLHAPDGRFVARIDLAYPRHRVAIESDGRTHAVDQKQFARDADRWEEIRAEGWRLVRILSHHLRPDPQVAIDKVTAALWDAGWRPGRA
ncbi:DUF559 domain-containing protein [Microbacterium fluvii]|uniref:DUF559 domain-containing protein n=1 Tax=Microbacterium fluvii TaxID=415215 RepID=A0ABW2HET4_9MICO|nr:DUF559 domain-containing protein [Microbacterium fluvii]MCU4671605.1 DUF559 domain-containing protein [Microbacterium fluvii]